MAMATRRPRVWLATLTLSVGALTLSQSTVVLQGRAADSKRESGIYLESADTGGKDEPKQLSAQTVQITPEGLGASMATMGFKKPKMISKISGEKASLRVAPQSSFLFVFGDGSLSRGPSPDADMSKAMEQMQSQMKALPARSGPKDYMLIALTTQEGERVYNSGTKKEFKVSIEKVEPNVYRIKPTEPLPAGEYAFAYNSGGGAAGMLWDFAVDGAATK